MRVNTGLAKGRRLKSVKGMATRPTADKVKLALFNILGAKVMDCIFLDLFAGTGAIAIEALSRGARQAVLVDNHPHACKVIKENLELTGLKERAEVLCLDALGAIPALMRSAKVFDIIFVDPPYDSGLVPSVLEGIGKGKLLANQGVLVVESRARDSLPVSIEGLESFRQATYGDTSLTFYKQTS